MVNVQKNILLKNLTTLEIGGPTQEFAEVTSEDQLKEALQYARENHLEILLIGGGSNLLISDEGFPGLVIKNRITGIETDGEVVKVKGGTPLQDLVNFTIEKGLAGANKLTGIPGTIGGAVYGNAGAYGQTISDFIEKVVVLPNLVIASDLKERGNLVLTKENCRFSYRDSNFKNTKDIILEVHFKFPKGNTETLREESAETLQKRLLKYKPGIKCPGSFFKNVLMDNLSEELKKAGSKSLISMGIYLLIPETDQPKIFMTWLKNINKRSNKSSVSLLNRK